MSKEKQTAEEILEPLIYKNVDGFGDAITPHSAELAMEIFANQIEAEIQKEIDELKKDNDDAHFFLDKMKLEYDKLKQSADEMVSHLEDAINIPLDSTNYEKYMKVIDNYKKLI